MMISMLRVFFAWGLTQFHAGIDNFAFAVVMEPEGGSEGDQAIDYLHIFNGHRQNLMPSPANMMLLEWSEELAGYSDDVSSTCSWDTPEPDTPGDEYLGFRIDVPPDGDVQYYIKSALDDESKRCTVVGNCSDSYLKTIWHGIKKLGCSTNQCESSGINGSYVVCYYDSEPQVESLESAYTIGEHCSECSGDFPACDTVYSLCVDRVPAALEIIQQPGPNATKAGVHFESYPVVVVLDERGAPFTAKLNPACQYEIVVEFGIRSHHEARFRGKEVVSLLDGIAEFSDLAISQYGEYTIRFFLDSPKNYSNHLTVESDMVKIAFPPATLDMCKVEEGLPRFERYYDWLTPNCTAVCVEDCQGQRSECYGFEGCGPNAYCEDGACKCKTLRDLGHFRFNAESLREVTKPIIICEPNKVALRVDKCGLNAIGFTLSDMYILGPKISPVDIDYLDDIDKQLSPYVQSCAYNDCRGRVTVGDDRLEYEFAVSGNFGDCNADVIDNGTHTTYKHIVRGYGGPSSAQISRKRSLSYEVTCTYIKAVTLSPEFGIDVFLGNIALSLSDQGQLDVVLGIFTDSTYGERITSTPLILVPDPVYVGIQLQDIENTDVVLFADHCYATSTDDPQDETAVHLIVNGCAVDDSITVAQNGEEKEVYFSFNSFVFSDQPDNATLFVQCDVVVCASDLEPCTVSCNNRRKREVKTKHKLTGTISLGPLNIENGEKVRKRSLPDIKYSSYFAKAFATQELAYPPVARTTGIPSVDVHFS